MALKPHERIQRTLTYAANEQTTLELPRNYAYRGLHLRLIGQIDVSGGSASGAVKDSCGAQFVRRLEIRANGRDTIKSIDLETLHRLTQIRYGTRPGLTAIANGDAANNQAVEVCAYLPFEMWQARTPVDTLLNSRGLDSLDLIVTWGALDDLFDATNDRTVAIDSMQLQIQSEEYVGVARDQQFAVNKELSSQYEVTATSSDFRIRIPRGNIYRGIVIVPRVDGKLNASVVNGGEIRIGTEVLKKFNAAQHLQRMKTVRAIESWPTGYLDFEFAPAGLLTEALDARGISEDIEISLDVTKQSGTNILHVYPVEVILPPTPAA